MKRRNPYPVGNIIQSNLHSFGMLIKERTFSSANYRYGFNSQEKVDEVAGEGNTNTAEYWEYDTRLGRRWNLDPKPNPSISDYAAFANNPIFFNDVIGDIPWQQVFKGKTISHHSDFAQRRDFKENGVVVHDFHNGIDMPEKSGTVIRTLAAGKVIEASYDKWNGNHVRVDHGNGIKLVYDHMVEQPLVKAGDQLKDGGDIGKVGSTGLSTGNHLHISMTINGQYADIGDVKDLQKFLTGDETVKISVMTDKKTGKMEDRIYQINKDTGKLMQLPNTSNEKNSQDKKSDIKAADTKREKNNRDVYN